MTQYLPPARVMLTSLALAAMAVATTAVPAHATSHTRAQQPAAKKATKPAVRSATKLAPEAAQASDAAQAAQPSQKARTAAALATATSPDNACADARPFYWEIGDGQRALAQGSVSVPGSKERVTINTPMLWASASKWVYGAYVAEKRAGKPNAADVQFLTMRSGFGNLGLCRKDQTVDSCLAEGGGHTYSADLDGRFAYNGAHMQVHASMNGLGPMGTTGLTAELRAALGKDVALGFTQPLLSGGGAGTPATYARFLRKMIVGELAMGRLLGKFAVCASPEQCGFQQAVASPSPEDEKMHYSLGHWVEDDPVVGDGAFSSGGALGFYPWIDADKRFYGVVARQAERGGPVSRQCGRLIRAAWADGLAR